MVGARIDELPGEDRAAIAARCPRSAGCS